MDNDAPLRLHFDRFELDEANARLAKEGVAVPVPPKAFGVLCTLLRRPGQLVTKNQLLDAVWGHRFVSDSVLKTTISELRGVLADDARSPRYVETAARRGYRFVGTLLPPAAPAGIDLQPPGAAPAIIGRSTELDRLRALWSAAQGGQRQVCWIAGEAGIGKTTLIDGLLATLGPVAQAHGQCVEQFGAAEPYLPVLDALGHLCRHDASLPALLRTVAPTWLLQLPWLTTPAEHEQLRSALAAVSQDRMLREFAELVERYTAARPLLLVTEDLHWCDDATVRLIDHVARRRTPARLLWIGSFRVAELVASGHALGGVRHELRVRHLAHELLLDPFSEAELAQYLARRLPAAATQEALVQRIHRQTDGLPLFVANVVEDLGADAQPARNDAWPVPESLAGVIERQIERLPRELAQLLQAAAVCGVQFSVGLLADVLQRERAEVAAGCDTLVRGQYWLAPVGVAALGDGSLDMQHAFRHALYREVFYQRSGALERASLHRRVAQALAARRSAGAIVSAAELATHCERGLDPIGALHAYAAAAENALRCFAPVETLQLATHALQLLAQCPEGPQRLEIELTLAQLAGSAHAQSTGVASAQAKAAFQRAAELAELLPGSPNRPWALTGMAWMCTSHGEYDTALGLGRRLLQFADGTSDPIVLSTACCASAVPLMQHGDFAAALPLVQRAVAATESMEPGRLEVPVALDPGSMPRSIGAVLQAHLGHTVIAQQWMQAALERSESIRQPISRGFAHRCAGMVLTRIDDPARLHALATRFVALVREHKLGQGYAPSQCLLGWAEAALGDAGTGYRRILDACVAHTEAGARFDISHFWLLAAQAAWLAGDRAACGEHLQQGLALLAQIGERVHLPDLLAWRGRLELAQGLPDHARATLREAAAVAQGMGAAIAELEARTALCRLPGVSARDVAALRKVRAAIDDPPAIAPLQRADAVLAEARPRR